MSVYTKIQLSGSTNGRPIKVTATSSPGTTIHTATSTTGEMDEIYLWAANTSGAAVALTCQWGGTTDPDDDTSKGLVIEANSEPVLIAPGLLLAGGLLVKVFAATTAVITVFGFANRISQ